MKSIITTILIFFALPCSAFDYSVVTGQWAVYHGNLISKEKYHYLNINSDFSGQLVSSLGYPPITRKFKSSDITKRNGHIEINLNKNEKAVFSAWKSKSGIGRLNGVIYMYKESGELFNTLYLPLELLHVKHELLKNEKIKELSTTIR